MLHVERQNDAQSRPVPLKDDDDVRRVPLPAWLVADLPEHIARYGSESALPFTDERGLPVRVDR